MRRFVVSVLTLMGVFLFGTGIAAIPSGAQASTLRGTITAAGGATASGVSVEALTANTTAVVASTSSNSSGVYSLILPPATYDLRITVPAAGSVPSSQSIVSGVVVGAGTTNRDITVGSSLPIVSGHATVNGFELSGGTPFGANAGILNGWFGGQFGGSAAPVMTISFRKNLGGGQFGSPIFARPMNGSYSVPMEAGTYEVFEAAFISDQSTTGFGSGTTQSVNTVQLNRKTSSLVVNGNVTLPDANFVVVPFNIALQNSDGSSGVGNIVFSPDTPPADGYFSSVFRFVSGSSTIPVIAGATTLKVNYAYPQASGITEIFGPSTRRTLQSSTSVNVVSGGVATVALPTLPRVSGNLTLNGSSVVNGTTFGAGSGALQGWTLEGTGTPLFPGGPVSSTSGVSISFTKVPSSAADLSLSVQATTSSYDVPLEPGTYNVKFVLALQKKSSPGSQSAVFTKYLSNVSVASNLALPSVDFAIVPHQVRLTNANGSPAVGAFALGEAQPAPAPHPDGIFYLSRGSGLSQYDPLVLAQPSSLKITPSSSDPTIIASSTLTPAGGGTTTVVLSPLSAITGVLGIDGDPAKLGSVITTPKLAGWLVEDTSGGGILRTIGVGSSVSFLKHTAVGRASPIVFSLPAGNATFSVPLEAGTYDVVASLALSKWVVNSATSFQGLRYVTLKRHLYDVVVSSSAETALPPIDFAVSVHTVKLVKADGSPAAGLVEISAPAGTSNARSFEFVSYMVDPVTGLVDAVVFDDPAVLTVRTDIYNRTALASGPVTPINGRLTTVAFGSSTNVVVGSADNDGDNIADDVEAQAPNHDANSDGIDDHTQANVASIPAGVQAAGSTGTAYVSVAVPAGLTLTNVQALPVPTGAAAPPAGTSLPEGLVKFVIPAVIPAADVTIRIYSSATNLTGYAKLFNGVWSQMPANRVTIGSGWVDVRITDNGIGDDDPVLGRISDPGAVIRGESNLPPTQPLGGPTTTTTLITTTTTTTSVATITTTSLVASVPTVASATPLSFAPIANPVSTTSLVATVTTTPGATQPTAVTQGATTTLATIPAAVLVQATPIPPAPGPAQAGEAEPAFTGSNSIPLTLAGGLFVLLGYLMFWATSHRGKSTLKRLANRKKLDMFE
jgi:hypothetical protein